MCRASGANVSGSPHERDGAPVTVLQVCTHLQVGGPARHLDGLVRGLPPSFVTEVAAGTAPDVEVELPLPVPVHDVPLVRRPSPARDRAALRRLDEVLAARRPALVATHTPKAGTLGRVAAWRSPSRPVTVHTFHGHLLDGSLSAPVRRAVLLTERRLARRTDALVAVSPEVRDELVDAGVGHPDRWHVLPIALDLDGFAPQVTTRGRLRARLGLDPGTPLVGAVGRLAAIKDLGVLLEAAARLSSAVHVVLVGDGPDRARLTDLAAELGIAERVHLVGWWDEVTEVYPDLDVVVLTSRNEGTPSALLEASAAARPVVATDVGGVGHVLGPGGGWLVPTGSVAGVADAIRAALTDREEAARRATAARDHVLATFGTGISAAGHAALYTSLLEAR
jgi:glycosyltransferase involved in cell wall biosynthesis